MAPENKPIFIFDMMRNRSHLFFRYLGTHPGLQNIWHPFLSAFLFGPETVFQKTVNKDEEGNDIDGMDRAIGEITYADAIEKFRQDVRQAQAAGKTPVINEHCQNVHKQKVTLSMIRGEVIDFPVNPTVIPDDIFNDLTPVFVIRHPVFSTPSAYIATIQTTNIRPGGEDWKLVTAVPLQRRLFDHFCAKDGKPPIVVDGDDIIWRTSEVSQKLAQALNFSPEGLSQVWKRVPEEERSEDPLIRHFLQTIDDSVGIEHVSEHAPVPDLQKAHLKWSEQYGVKVADQLRSSVEDNIPHYEYMKSFRI